MDKTINWDALEKHWVHEIERENIMRAESKEKIFEYEYY